MKQNRKRVMMMVFLILLFSISNSYAAVTQYEPQLVNAVDCSIEDWFGTAETRAIFSVMTAIEYSNASDYLYDSTVIHDVENYPSYVTLQEDGTVLGLWIVAEEKVHCTLYLPALETAAFAEPLMGAFPPEHIEIFFELQGFEYYKNTEDALWFASDWLLETMGLTE